MFLDGIALAGYRSFGPKLQRIGPLSKVNLLIGANNSGKSNVLAFLKQHHRRFVKAAKNPGTKSSIAFDDLDWHLRNSSAEMRFGFALNLNACHDFEKALCNANQIGEKLF